ncbi:SHOCT domain-containing protein [Streptomyces sp. P9(2023)]|uniref:SHOCT domain-containing protein n=1 Tax=Streptomyces sp. P9(2023) TaxID=3064394 RepID=UPI0028F3EC2D|nr:SHOCT domain-containing protein [Streptomyces sp. P9(2023)]MDT9688183.1 SHOCT domain-containing protein [Streptomyces sp. P9(2023)]
MTQRIVEKRGANHGLHVFLTIISCGIWAITGWPIAAAMGRKTVTRVPTYPQQYPQQQYAPPQQPAAIPPPPQHHPQPTAPSWAQQQTPAHGQQRPTVSTGGQQDLISGELMRLAQLRDQGILSPAEFEAQKARLLGQ